MGVIYNPFSGNLELQKSGSSGVSSLNSLTGALSLAAGANITVTPSGSTITIASSGGGASWTKYTLTYTSFSASSSTNTQTIVALAAKTLVAGLVIKHSTAFSGGSITDYTVNVTDGASWSYSSGTFDVFQTVSDTAYQSVQQQHPVGFASGGTVYITATSTGDTLNHAAAGSVDVWIKTEALP